jgi:hypothetical protein
MLGFDTLAPAASYVDPAGRDDDRAVDALGVEQRRVQASPAPRRLKPD